MSRISEKSEWAEAIYELRETDPVLGGSDGISNMQAAQLAGRTQWLKSTVESHAAAPDPHPQYREATGEVAGTVEVMQGEMAQLGIEQQAHANVLQAHEANLAELDQAITDLQSTLPAPSGSQLLFIQSTAPAGWTKLTTHHDKALRIVSGTVGSGGSVAFSDAFAARSISGSIGATTLTVAQMPSHTHYMPRVVYDNNKNHYAAGFFGVEGYVSNARNAKLDIAGSVDTGVSGSDKTHTHSLSINAPDFNVQYVDAIIARKD